MQNSGYKLWDGGHPINQDVSICPVMVREKSARGNLMPILKLDEHDEGREIEFELNYLKSLTIKERFILMQEKSREMQKLMRNCGHGKSPEIIKRA